MHLNNHCFSGSFRSLAGEDIAWLRRQESADALRLVLEAVCVCLKLASGEIDVHGDYLKDFFFRWHGVIYQGLAYKDIMDANLIVANRIRVGVDKSAVQPSANYCKALFLKDAERMRAILLE